MEPTSTESSPDANRAHQSWRQTEPGTWSRACAGSEQGTSYNQNVRDGHTEITLEVAFTATVSTTELIQRVRNAWLVAQSTRPEIAVQISTGTELPQMLRYETLKDEAQATSWLQDTLHVVRDQTAKEVAKMTYCRPMPTKGTQSIMYLVTGPASDPENPNRHSLVWNLSHVMCDIFSVNLFYNYFLQTVTEVPGDRNLALAEIDYTGIMAKLPVTPVDLYEKKYKPTNEERQKGLDDALAQSQLLNSKMSQSIAMYPETDPNREHDTYCMRLKYTTQESQALLASLREKNISITFAAAAATILAVRRMYGQGHETGALLGMTRNARRWVDTVTSRDNGGSVVCASDVVFLWIEFKESWFSGSTQDAILGIGAAIKNQLGPHLLHPHYISTLEFTSDRVVEALAKEGEPVPAPCAPGFSPQGALALKQEFHSGGVSVFAKDFVHSGRQINVSAWVGMFSLWGQITLSMGFDCKYWNPVNMEAFMALTKDNLGSLIPGRFQQGGVSKI